MRRQITEKVPHVHGKSSELVKELMEGFGKDGEGESGKDKFWGLQNFPGLPGLGMMEKGEDWKGPMSAWSVWQENGPRYLPLEISASTILWNSPANSVIDLLFGGVWVSVMEGKLTVLYTPPPLVQADSTRTLGLPRTVLGLCSDFSE